MARIILGCSASAALHKGADLASKLSQAGHEVRAVLTERAAQLIAPQLFEALTSNDAYVAEFGDVRKSAMDHIHLSQWAELILVAPGGADLVAKLSHGIADDLLTTVVLATPLGVPRLLAPAMNPHMLAHPAVARNLDRLASDGWRILGSGAGHMACGVHGQGRLLEPAEIVARVKEVLES